MYKILLVSYKKPTSSSVFKICTSSARHYFKLMYSWNWTGNQMCDPISSSAGFPPGEEFITSYYDTTDYLPSVTHCGKTFNTYHLI